MSNTQRRKVTRVRHGIEGDAKLGPDEDLVWDKEKKAYFAVKRSPKQKDVNSHKWKGEMK